MGYGAHMTVKNDTSRTIRTFVSDANCVYDNGQENSNLSLFNDATILGKSSLPKGEGQYIEAKNSGGCFFEASKFTLTIMNDSGTELSVLKFWDSTANWTCENSRKEWVSVYINNTGEQGTITITVLHAGPGMDGEVPTGDELFAAPPPNAGKGDETGNDDLKKGTAGTDAQNRRWKGEDEDDDLKKGTAGTDAQNRRWKDDDEDLQKGTAGTDAQNRRRKGEDEDDDLKKGTAGTDAQNRRWKGEDES